MAGAGTLNIKLEVTGLGQTRTFGVDTEGNAEDLTLTVPVELASGYVVVATATATALQLSDLAPQIALAKMTYLYIKAKAGTIYLVLDTAGTATFAEAAADIVIQNGDANLISVNPAGNLGVKIDAASATDAFEWALLGKA
jgi:hypothetical protein